MSIKVHIPDRLRFSLAKGRGVFEVNGNSVGECLKELTGIIPAMEKALFYKTQKLHSYIKIMLNGESLNAEDLSRQVGYGDEIHISMQRN